MYWIILFNAHSLPRNPTATKGKYAADPEGQFPCLAEYGGPIDPNIALGGFPSNPIPISAPYAPLPPISPTDDSYTLATAMLVTFIVNNHVDEADNKDAKLWEAEFLKYLKEYKGVNITLAFIAEVNNY